MQHVLDDFAQRHREVEGFLRMLSALERRGARITNTRGGTPVDVQDEWRRVAKASAYLMLYNVVESSVRSALLELHSALENEGCTLREASSALQQLWVRMRHARLTRETASPLNYEETARNMVLSVLANEIVQLDRDRLPIAGNLDADSVRKLLHDHGVPVKTHRRARGGVALDEVKDQRNALAHGNRSFSESGRDVTIRDLRRMSLKVKIFLKSVISNVERCIANKQYRASPRLAGGATT